MANAIFSPFSGYILYDAVWSGTAPISTYSLTTYNSWKPDRRVKYSGTSITLIATLGASRLAQLFALPMHNATSLTLNGNVIPVPTMPTGPYGRLPLTTVFDLRTIGGIASGTFTIAASGPSPITFGAGIWLGTCVDFTANYRPGLVDGFQYLNTGDTNVMGTVNRVRTRCRVRFKEFGIPTRDTQRDQVMDWIDSGEGSGLPSIFWPNPTINDALYGSFADEASNVWMIKNFSPIDGLRFTEWSKGEPLL